MALFFQEFVLNDTEQIRHDPTASAALHSLSGRRTLEDALWEAGYTVLRSELTLGLFPDRYFIGCDWPEQDAMKSRFYELANGLYRAGGTLSEAKLGVSPTPTVIATPTITVPQTFEPTPYPPFHTPTPTPTHLPGTPGPTLRPE
ncbi:hypothetical protein HYY74_00585 [Candidatus Woesearchaeota archaeon]|nr:hypothetical protein [Candidatus Woesearchaeota archaeon]